MRSPLALALGVLVALVPGLTAGPAQAADTLTIVGHRCRDYTPQNNHENTLKALRNVAKLDSKVWCELDTQQSSDGWQFVWHDPTWKRVADPDTVRGLPAMVGDTSHDQIRGVRTTGGDTVPGLAEFIKVAGRLDVNLMIEVKNAISHPKKWVKRAKRAGIKVRWYQDLDAKSCTADKLGGLAKRGALIGGKSMSTCPLTPEKAADLGLSFVSVTPSEVTKKGMMKRFRKAKVKPWVRGATKDNWDALAAKGVPSILVNDPAEAVKDLGY